MHKSILYHGPESIPGCWLLRVCFGSWPVFNLRRGRVAGGAVEHKRHRDRPQLSAERTGYPVEANVLMSGCLIGDERWAVGTGRR